MYGKFEYGSIEYGKASKIDGKVVYVDPTYYAMSSDIGDLTGTIVVSPTNYAMSSSIGSLQGTISVSPTNYAYSLGDIKLLGTMTVNETRYTYYIEQGEGIGSPYPDIIIISNNTEPIIGDDS